MDKKNYLNFDSKNPNRKVYRYTTLGRLYRLFENRENVLVHPSLWDDPFENFILNAKVKSPDGSVREFGLRDRVYAQCWTTEYRSDAMWRIYSPKTENGRFEGVRIRSTVKKLADCLTKGVKAPEVTCSFIGKVRYLGDTRLFDAAREIFDMGLSHDRVAQTLLVKRTAFQHEKEVRLIHRKLSGKPAANGLYSYSVDPHVLVEQIMLDPRVKPSMVDSLKHEIQSRTRFQGELKWSLLYKPPEPLVLNIGV